MNTYKSDVVVIGAGIAGLVAAYEALNKGLSVSLIDRDEQANMGGLAKLAFGGMALVGTPLQKRMGIDDTPAIALQDWHSFAQFSDEDYWPRKWAEYYVENSNERVYHWLVNHGLKFFPAVNWVERGLNGDGNSLPRYHVIWGTGYRLVELFIEKLAAHKNKAKLTIVHRHRVEDLITDQNRVSGCRATDELNNEAAEFYGASVIVACGGINGCLKKVRENWYKPWGQAPKEILNGSHPYADGKLHDVVAANGGNVTHLDKMWNYAAGIPHPKPQFDGHGLSLIPCKSALWLDATGARIGPEPLVTGFDTNELCRRVAQQEHSHTWQVLNWRIAAKEFAISGSEHNPSIRDRKLFKFIKEVLFGNNALIKQISEESDHFVIADDIESLFEKMNSVEQGGLVCKTNLHNAINSYDEMIRRGKGLWNDDQLRRILHARSWRSDKVRTCKPKPLIDKGAGPLIAIKIRLISRKSLGGIQTNLDSQVLNTQGEPIKGLYAIGEASGFGGGGASGFKSLEGTFLSGCILTARSAIDSLVH